MIPPILEPVPPTVLPVDTKVAPLKVEAAALVNSPKKPPTLPTPVTVPEFVRVAEKVISFKSPVIPPIAELAGVPEKVLLMVPVLVNGLMISKPAPMVPNIPPIEMISAAVVTAAALVQLL